MKRVIAAIFLLAGTSTLAGCVSVTDINRANTAIEAAWQADVDKLERAEGVRTFAFPASVVHAALAEVIAELGMVVTTRDLSKGIVRGYANAPRPLSDEKWKAVDAVEGPRLKKIVGETVGPISSYLFVLQPTAYQVRYAAAVVGGTGNISSVALTARLVRIEPAPAGTVWPDYPPPLAAKLGFAKVWANLSEKLAATVPPAASPAAAKPDRRL